MHLCITKYILAALSISTQPLHVTSMQLIHSSLLGPATLMYQMTRASHNAGINNVCYTTRSHSTHIDTRKSECVLSPHLASRQQPAHGYILQVHLPVCNPRPLHTHTWYAALERSHALVHIRTYENDMFCHVETHVVHPNAQDSQEAPNKLPAHTGQWPYAC